MFPIFLLNAVTSSEKLAVPTRKEQAILEIQRHMRSVLSYRLRMEKEYQKILQKEQTGTGRFIGDIIDDLKQARDDYFIFFLITRAARYIADRDFSVPNEYLAYIPNYARNYDNDAKGVLTQELSWRLRTHFQNLSTQLQFFNANQLVKDKLQLIFQKSYDPANIQKLEGSDFYAIDNLPLYVNYGVSLDIYPSIYQLIKYMYSKESLAVAPSEHDLNELLEQIKSSWSLKRISDYKNKHLIFDIIEKEIVNLPPTSINDKFIEKILQNIEKVLGYIVSQSDAYPRLTLLYEFLNDLIFVYLAYQHPYELQDYTNAMQTIQKERFGDQFEFEHFPTSSGMDAIVTAAIAAAKPSEPTKNVTFLSMGEFALNPSGTLKIHYPNGDAYNVYYETENIFTPTENSDIVLLGLTTETVLDTVDVERLTQEILSRPIPDKGITLIIDTTLEYGPNDPAHQLISRLRNEILEGKISVLLCKSFQKFVTLGTGKVQAGDITLISYNPHFKPCREYLRQTSPGIFRDHKDEFQMIIHFLKYNAENEFNFVKQASRNAQFVYHILKEQKPSAHISVNGPFIHLTSVDKSLAGKLARAGTFGLSFSSVSSVNSGSIRWGHRVSIGLEPEEILKEIFTYP